MEICNFCGDERKNKISLSQHRRLCKLNPNRALYHKPSLGKKPWNKGLTKETNKILFNQSIKHYLEKYQEGKNADKYQK